MWTIWTRRLLVTRDIRTCGMGWCSSGSAACSELDAGRCGEGIELDQDREQVGDAPVIGELSVADAEDVNGFEADVSV